MNVFIAFVSSSFQDYIPALLGLSLSYFKSDYPQEARSSLKKIAKMEYDWNYRSDFEKTYMLLAEHYSTAKKFDLSMDLCKRVLMINRRNYKAWEVLAKKNEIEDNHVDAMCCYEKCWNLLERKKCSIGLKLAAHFLKRHRITDALKIHENIKAKYPSKFGPRNNIMNKCIETLRA